MLTGDNDNGINHSPCDPVGLLQSPKTPESRKYEKIRNPQIQKIPKNAETAQKRASLGAFLCIFSVLFSSFRNPWGWGFRVFFRIFGILGFLGSAAGPQDHNIPLQIAYVRLSRAMVFFEDFK